MTSFETCEDHTEKREKCEFQLK